MPSKVQAPTESHGTHPKESWLRRGGFRKNDGDPDYGSKRINQPGKWICRKIGPTLPPRTVDSSDPSRDFSIKNENQVPAISPEEPELAERFSDTELLDWKKCHSIPSPSISQYPYHPGCNSRLNASYWRAP